VDGHYLNRIAFAFETLKVAVGTAGWLGVTGDVIG